jgi:manganese-dependent inorganic pyrophosphatase
MVTLAAPCHALMDAEPLTVRRDDLVADIAEDVKGIHYRAAVAVDSSGRPVGLVTRSDLVNPEPRRVLLVDHAESAQSVPGIDEAEIVEILDHHHIGSIETRVPVAATFDPVGSTATLVVERFRQAGLEPQRPTALMLLGAVLSDTVILNSPTTTPRDHAVIEHLERILSLDAEEFGREMFSDTSDVSHCRPRRSSRTTSRTTRSAPAGRSRSRSSRPSATPCSSAATSCSRRLARSASARAMRCRR